MNQYGSDRGPRLRQMGFRCSGGSVPPQPSVRISDSSLPIPFLLEPNILGVIESLESHTDSGTDGVVRVSTLIRTCRQTEPLGLTLSMTQTWKM